MAASLLFARTTARWLTLILVGVLLVSVVALGDPQIDIGRARRLSLDQAISNIVSIIGVGDDSEGGLEATKAWRLAWWDSIIGYTVSGPYFWTGKGFGVNLADDDGFQVEADGSLRSPHNGHITMLARGGVPMLTLWILVQAAFLTTVLRAARRARAAGLEVWSRTVGWVVVYWLAAIINMSFDVYLEGPMGGVLFWSIVGLGLAIARIVDERIAALPSGGPADSTATPPSPPDGGRRTQRAVRERWDADPLRRRAAGRVGDA
jgi:hypothetical protein